MSHKMEYNSGWEMYIIYYATVGISREGIMLSEIS